ncbi:MAG: PilZ domain-containing protein [Nitrospirota bacterium]
MITEKRTARRVTLTGTTLVIPGSGGRALTAVVTNVSSTGAGLRVPEAIPPNEAVTVTMAFLDQAGTPTQEKLSGMVAWLAPSPRGFLVGLTWSHPIDPDTHPALAAYVAPPPPTTPTRPAAQPAKRRSARTARSRR